MTGSFKDYEAAFIKKIRLAATQEEVKQLINNTLKTSDYKHGGIPDAAFFIDAIIGNLKMLNPMNKDAREWSNINMARIYCQQIKRNIELTR